jgi:uncharacterized membrane protein YhiD involved in acid resistance
MTAAIGMTIGLAQWALGIILTVIVFLVLNIIGRLKSQQK